ncbi:aromatic acid exporter family protein [Streptomonospora wellingtoniae]|uniref:Aromatic acid exporter family protein n=1 Tax=Streptomonospora wellingtoniae TaxID=3075544 RepID=A0ABU2KZW2_9ACTN|nr:aromatic acid exporter family protein [Streptomonospora sp. DSM 45055]MDT0304803.1 aromatic acid exporter family protein [Streptomonospora sp. DSM 45055]
MGQWIRRARREGHERNTLLLIGKSTLAATIAWVVSYNVLQAAAPAFAPFSAVLMIQVTIYQSIAQSVRYLGAVGAGVAVQGLIGFLAGPGLVTFAVVTMVALVIGRWPRLGSQGSQVVTAAFFAFAMYVMATSTVERATQLGSILLLVLIGCAIGVLVNLVVVPPMRFRSAEHGVRSLAHAVCDLLSDMHPPLREGELIQERTGQWRQRASRLDSTVAQAHSAVRTAEESVYYNPRRFLLRRRIPTFSGYVGAVQALDRISYQLASVTRTLDQAASSQEGRPESPGFLERYADFLAALAEITAKLSELDEKHIAEQVEELTSRAGQSREYASRLSEGDEGDEGVTVSVTGGSSPYATLLVEASRLQEEFEHACDLLKRSVEQERSR